MSTASIIMVVLICLGCALGLAGLCAAAYRGLQLMKSARATGVKTKTQVQQLTGRVQRLEPRFREMAAKQKAVAEKLESLSTTAQKSD